MAPAFSRDLALGTYSTSQAARLAGVTPAKVRRWLRGYERDGTHGVRQHAPVWRGELGNGERYLELGFRDLMELQAVREFLDAGVTWRVLRKAHARAEELVGHAFPFCTRKFYTDGYVVFADADEVGYEGGITDIVSGQAHFDEIVRPMLVQLEFGRDGMPLRWWPLGTKHSVVVDPRRGYGQPIVAAEGVPTDSLASAVRAGDSAKTVARWFQVSMRSMRDALKFEGLRVA